jgi:hypothetical protein
MSLDEEEKKELQRLARSRSLREDLEKLARSRHRIFFSGDAVDTDRVLEFLCEYNAFIHHAPRKFRPIVDRLMKL